LRTRADLPAPVDRRVELAVLANAGWCDLVCVGSGRPTAMSDAAWICQGRSPEGYPDAITLRAGLGPDELRRFVLARIDTAPGASIKDSFVDQSLAEVGFEVLFDATWIYRPAVVGHPNGPTRGPSTEPHRRADPVRWRTVDRPAELRSWVDAHGVAAVGRPGVLGHPDVTVIGGYVGERLTGGAIAHRTGSVVGLSNVFTIDGQAGATFRAVTELVGHSFPDRPIVGYESGADLAAAIDAGFEPIGPLRVWLRS
jgi:hypothetical protein